MFRFHPPTFFDICETSPAPIEIAVQPCAVVADGFTEAAFVEFRAMWVGYSGHIRNGGGVDNAGLVGYEVHPKFCGG
jgi:hypothetical protein